MESFDHIKAISIRDEFEIDNILRMCKNNQDKKISLFCKESDIAVLLIDLLRQQDLDFEIYGIRNRFSKSGACKDILSFLILSLHPENMDAFKQICYKSKLFFNKKIIGQIICYCNANSKSIYDILQNDQLQLNRWQIENIRRFLSVMKSASEVNTLTEIIRIVFDQLYSEYFYEHEYRHSILDVLNILAAKETSIEEFIWHMSELEYEYVEHETNEINSNIIITSTDRFEEIICDTAYIIEI